MAEEPQQMEVEAPAPVEAPKGHSPGEEGGLTTYPVALATQGAVLEDQQLFIRLLQDLNSKLQTAQPRKYRPSKYRVPTVAGRELNLHQLYQEVSKLGGAIAVTADNKWADVVVPFQFTGKFNLSAIKKIYSTILWHFEQVYQHKAEGQKLLEPPELPASAAADPAAADGVSTRPSRNRRGTSLAAIIAATDNIDSDGEAEAAAASGKQPAAGKKGDTAAGKKEDSSKPDSTAGNTEKAGPSGAGKQRKPQQQQQAQAQKAGSGSTAAPPKTPELVGFLKAGKGRKDLTGQLVTGKVDAKFDCGYFVSLNIAGQSFNGILYCPTAVAAATAAGASAQAAAGRAAAAKKEDKAAANGSAVKREASAGADGDNRGGKRRRAQPLPDSASKPKSAKTAFNFFAAEQWPVVKAELGASAAPQEISRAVGEKWNRATEEERQPYVNKAAEDKNRFEHEMQGWKAGLESPVGAAAAPAAEGDGPAPADTAAASAAASAAAPAAGVTGPTGKPPIGKGLFLAGVPEAMDVDAAAGDAGANQQQYKHKLKFKLTGAAGSLKPADGQHAAEAAAVGDAATTDAATVDVAAVDAVVAPVGVTEAAAQHVDAVPPAEAVAADVPAPQAAAAEAPAITAAKEEQQTAAAHQS